jgi:putative ABC transport system permease protein
MHWVSRLFHRSKQEAQLDSELRFHVEQRTADNIAAGMNPDEARRRALAQFGGLEYIKEETRDARGTHFLETLFQDIHFALRVLRKSPRFTAAAVLTLALGIGANTAIFSLLDAVLLRPLPFKNPNRLVVLFETNLKEDENQAPPTPADFRDWRDRNNIFEELVAWSNWDYSVGGTNRAEEVLGTRVSAAFFRMVGVKPYLGRAFSTGEEEVGRDHLVVLSYGFWQRHFAAARDVIGKNLTIDGKPFVIVGVLPAAFRFLPTRHVDLWMPFAFTSSDLKRDNHSIAVWGRLKSGISLSQAQTEMNVIAHQLAQAYPDTNADWNVKLVPWRESMVRDIRPTLLLLSGAVWLVLLLACANVASLLLARSAGREKEVAIRRALGASSQRLIRQLLTESALLALVGGAMGLLLAFLGLKVLMALIPASIHFPRLNPVGVDRPTAVFTFGLSLLTGFLFGLVPARYAAKVNLTESLKEGGVSSSPSLRGSHIHSLLVVLEFALAVMLLAGAGLMIQSFLRLRSVNPGFNPKNVLTMEMSLASSKYATPYQVADFYQQALQRIDALPGVRYGGAVNFLPLTFGVHVPIAIEGRPSAAPSEEITANYLVINPSYFRAMDIPLLRGRYFTEQDTQNAPGVMIVNQTMAHRFWPGEDVIGKRVRPMFPQSQAPWYPLSNSGWLTIVGVVANVKDEALNAELQPEMYMSYLQAPSSTMYLAIRTASDPGSLASAVRSAIRDVDKDQPIFDIRPMGDLVSESISQPRFNMILLAIFAALALLLAVTGIYAMISHWASQRTHEIGIRMALGAQRSDILKILVGQGVRLAIIGLALGLAATAGLTRLMSKFLYGISSTDPLTFVAVSILLLIVALAACYIPAHRAMRVDPMVALRHE